MRALLLTLLLLAPSLGHGRAPPWGDQVVNLIVTSQAWDGAQPWTKTTPSVRNAHATVVSAGPKGPFLLLTQASVVENATLVRVKKHGEPTETLVRVVTVDREANLALLTVDEPGWYRDLRPARLAARPPMEGEVTFVRWKGNQLEATQGRIARAVTISSRTGVARLVGLRVSTDLAAGGWAEPVFSGGALVGITMGQDGSEAQVVLSDFLRGWLQETAAADGPRGWIGELGVSVQDVRSPALAGWLGLEAPQGLLVLDVAQGSSACGGLARGDVLLAVDGRDLDADGNVKDPALGLLWFEHLLARFHPGEALPVRVLRDKQVLDLQLPLRRFTADAWLIPAGRLDPPPYLMAGGLVFREYDESYSARSTELRIVFQAERKGQKPDRRRIVVLASVLADPYNLGYHGLADLMVETVNGRRVDAISDVAEALTHPVDGYHVIGFRPNGRISEAVLDAAAAEEATRRIAESYGLIETWRAEVPPPDLGPPCP